MTLIEKLAIDQNITITKLANDVGVSRPTVYGWYNGKEPSVQDIIKLAQVLNVQSSKIFKDYI